jgi:hypothetical protein
MVGDAMDKKEFLIAPCMVHHLLAAVDLLCPLVPQTPHQSRAVIGEHQTTHHGW